MVVRLNEEVLDHVAIVLKHKDVNEYFTHTTLRIK